MSSIWPYQILGVKPTADEREIRRAYRELVMRHHPDRGGDPQKFRQIQEAYRLLTHSKAREREPREGRRVPRTPQEAAYQSAMEEYHRTMKEMYEASLRHQAAVMRLMQLMEAMAPREAKQELGKRFKFLRRFVRELSKA